MFKKSSRQAAICLSAAAEPNAREVNKRTPLHYARHPEAIAELLANGADPNLDDVNGRTALQINLSKEKSICRMERVHALLNGGADINHADNNGVTPLLSALEARRPSEFIELMIERGADINAQDVDGRTALHTAARHLCMETVNALIGHGASSTIVNNQGKTALEIANRSSEQTKQGKSTEDVANDYKVLSVIEAVAQKAALQEALHIQRDEPQTASRWRRM